MGRIRKSASALVTVQLRIRVHSSWGDNCTIRQVYDQAKEGAIGHLNRVFRQDPEMAKYVQLVGIPKIEAVTTEREDL